MRTNLDVLSKQLSLFTTKHNNLNSFFSYSKIMLYDAKKHLHPDSILVCDNSNLDSSYLIKAAICVVEDFKDIHTIENYPVLYIESAQPLTTIYHQIITTLFNNFLDDQVIQEQLFHISTTRSSTASLISRISKCIDEDMILFDQNFHVLVTNQDKELLNNFPLTSSNLELIERIRQSKENITCILNSKKHTLAPIWHNNILQGCLLLENSNQYSDTILSYVTSLISANLTLHSKQSDFNPYTYLLTQIIDNKISKAKIKEIKKQFTIHFPEKMIITCIQQDIIKKTDVIRQLSSLTIYGYLEKNNYIYTFFDEEFFSSNKDSLTRFIQENDITIGISNSFSDPSDTSVYMKQAKTVLTTGKLTDPELDLYIYSNYVIEDMLLRLSEKYDITLFYHPAIHIIQAYDKRYKTHYLEYLMVYLKFNGSMKDCANYYDVHYNSIKYRIKVIQNLCSLDLSDAIVFSHLFISMKIHSILQQQA